jgi:putative membrane protein
MSEEPRPRMDSELPDPGIARTVIGGGLMGVANIIPGVSGGTMMLATGLYEHFIEGVADITRLRRNMRSWKFIGIVAVAAVIAIGASVFPIKWGLDHCHHLMFALFIGLTLGGVPLLWRELHPIHPTAVVATAVGIAVMAVIAFALSQTSLPVNWLTYLIAGFIASAAMVLPGISGSYLLLIFGLYTLLTGDIKEFIGHLKDVDMAAAFQIGLTAILPIGAGIVLGIAGLTNVLKMLLHRFHQATLGLLLGLLLGSVLGLYPFRDLWEKDELIAAAPPVSPLNIALVLGALVLGFAITFAVSKMGDRG